MFKNEVKKVLAPALYYSGYYKYKISCMENKTAILMYHRISDNYNSDKKVSDFEAGIEKSNFESQMKFIKENMTPLSMLELVHCIKGNKRFPKRAIAVTFDDGYKDNYTNAYSILKKYDIPATIFITVRHIELNKIFWWDKVSEIIKKTEKTRINLDAFRFYDKNFIENSNYIEIENWRQRNIAIKFIMQLFKSIKIEKLTEAVDLLQRELDVMDEIIDIPSMLSWDQIEEMSRDNIDFGAHTLTHPDLTKIDYADAVKEIIDSKKILEDKINKKVSGFAYPYGLHEHYNNSIKNILSNSGFDYACSAITGAVTDKSDCYSLLRINLSNNSLPVALWKFIKNI